MSYSDSLRLDQVQAWSEEGCVDFGIELEGGVYLRVSRVDGIEINIREKDTIRQCIDAATEQLRTQHGVEPAKPSTRRYDDLSIHGIVTAYEQGIGHAFRDELSNPYREDSDEYAAWDKGRAFGRERGIGAPKPEAEQRPGYQALMRAVDKCVATGADQVTIDFMDAGTIKQELDGKTQEGH